MVEVGSERVGDSMEEMEESPEDRSVLEEVVLERKSADKNGDNLIEGHRGRVLQQHPCNTASRIVLCVELSVRCTLSDHKVWPQGGQDGEILPAHIQIAVLDKDTHRERRIASHLWILVGEALRDQGEDVLGEGRHSTLHSRDDLAETTNGRSTLAERTVLRLNDKVRQRGAYIMIDNLRSIC